MKKAQSLYAPKGIMLADDLPEEQDLDYVVMPDWWQKATNTTGLPFRKMVVIAGDSDSGKTTCSIEAMKAAQQQGVTVLYVETEGKTTKEDLRAWGCDLKKLYFFSESIAEIVYDETLRFINSRMDSNPNEKLLIVVDSIGNVLSKHDMDRSMADSSQKPGGKGKTNREGLNKLIAKRTQHNIALLIITYTYDNVGSPGKTNAGGKGINFFSSLTYQTSRKSWLEKTVKGEKVRIGAKVQWKLFKNHLNRANPGPKVIELDITSSGISFVGDTSDKTDSSSE